MFVSYINGLTEKDRWVTEYMEICLHDFIFGSTLMNKFVWEGL